MKQRKFSKLTVQEKVRNRQLLRMQHMVDKMRLKLPTGQHRRTFLFGPWELDLDPVANPNGKSYSTLVNTFQADPEKSRAENNKARDAYYKAVRQQALEEFKQSLQYPIVVPPAYNPDGPTTIDMSTLTTAGENNQ